MSFVRPFAPRSASTVNISVSSSSQNVNLGVSGDTAVCVYNSGTAPVFIEFGMTGRTAAVATGYPVAAGAKEILTARYGDGGSIYAAAIAAGSTGTVYFTTGEGI